MVFPAQRWRALGVSLHHIALMVEKKLLEVPLDVCRPDGTPQGHWLRRDHVVRTWTRSLEPLEQVDFVFPIDFCFGVHVEVRNEPATWPHVLERVRQLLVGHRLLMTKLIAWEGSNLE